MSASVFAALGLGAAALYFLNKNKSAANSGDNGSVIAPFAPATYNPPKSTSTNTFTPNTKGIDGTPYRDSKLYFGDKAQPYDIRRL